MKAILIGYPGSQFLVPASKYLFEKYLPSVEPYFLNYAGDVNSWSGFVADFLRHVKDDIIIFGLDDYLLNNQPSFEELESAESLFENPDVVTAKLCQSTIQEHEQYPVTTQYAMWDRKFLIWLLDQTTTPWDFEINGSIIFRGTGKMTLLPNFPVLNYNTSSALSKRWQGVSLKGLSPADVIKVKEICPNI